MKTLMAAGLVLLMGASLSLDPGLRCAAGQPAAPGADSSSPAPDSSASGRQGLDGVADSLAALRFVAAVDEEDLLDRMIGQMTMVGFGGGDERDRGVAAVRDQLAQGTIGGVVLYPENIRGARQLRNLTAFLANAKSDLIPLIAVDQEGGTVQRLTRWNGYAYFPSARDVASKHTLKTPDGALHLYEAMGRELAHAGINVNFGPVVDLNVNPRNPVIGRRKRSFGSDPKVVTDLARAFITAHREANVVTVAKHFPGHGSSSVDSHKVLADISKSWREKEIEPYVSLAHQGLLDMVMVGHLYHPRFSDAANVPASLSARAVGALRAKGWIGFNGVVVSDDMEMGAVRKAYSLEQRVVMAINAGTDLIVSSNVKERDPTLGPRIHAIIAAAVRDGRIPRARIEEAYGRMLLLKRRLMQRDLAGVW
jgi:beta-N-acetylhexosaminidase